MITLKTGVPGSGKTLSAVQELLQLSQDSQSGKCDPRLIYTNITGLAIPHVFLDDCTKWRDCPAGSLVVIDEAFLFGYDAKSQQSQVPDYIRDLAVHRKDYSLDFIFIAQHPKLLHVALRRQVGKHQHYRRLFGWGRAVCYEWDSAQDNLNNTKTAVMTQWSYPKSVFKAYKSSELHTKPRFKLPWFAWIPLALLPLAAWAFPTAYTAMHGAMTGKGVAAAPAPAAASTKPVSGALDLTLPMPRVDPPQLAASAPVAATLPEVFGCIRTATRCGCFGPAGEPVSKPVDVCMSHTNNGGGKPLEFPDSPAPRPIDAVERDAIAFAFHR